jgi:predicted DNA-binding transcriptional regulator AlpA
MQDALLTEKKAAPIIGVSVRALQKWRQNGHGPKYIKISNRCIRYDRADIDLWCARLKVNNTAQQTEAEREQRP